MRMSGEQVFSFQIRKTKSSDAPPDLTQDPFVVQLRETTEEREQKARFFTVFLFKTCSN